LRGPAPSARAGDGAARGAITFRLSAIILFSVMGLCVRLASETLPTGQIVFWRNALAIVPVVAYLAVIGRFPYALATRRPWGHVTRGILGSIAMLSYFASVARLPLALAMALIFLAPVLSVPAGVAFLRERPGLLVVAAVLLGLAGTGLMLWPALEGPSLDTVVATGVALGFLSALISALVRVQIRDLTSTEHPAAITFWFAVIASIVTLPSIALGWAPVEGTAIIWLVGAGLTGGLAQVLLCESLARAPVSRLAPLDYTGLVFAFAFDLLVFGLVPPALALAGAVLIVAASSVVALAPGPRRR
jgi:drug/metabolite transporter (DMT)-like permease